MISVQTIDSLTKDDRAMWRNIRKELEDVGITLDAWQTNHGFIMNWFVRMVSFLPLGSSVGNVFRQKNASLFSFERDTCLLSERLRRPRRERSKKKPFRTAAKLLETYHQHSNKLQFHRSSLL